MQHKWIRTAEDPAYSQCMYLEAWWRRDDVKECIVDIFKYRYQGPMSDSEGSKKPYCVCIYAEKPKESKFVSFRLLKEATQYADTMLRLNSLK